MGTDPELIFAEMKLSKKFFLIKFYLSLKFLPVFHALIDFEFVEVQLSCVGFEFSYFLFESFLVVC